MKEIYILETEENNSIATKSRATNKWTKQDKEQKLYDFYMLYGLTKKKHIHIFLEEQKDPPKVLS